MINLIYFYFIRIKNSLVQCKNNLYKNNLYKNNLYRNNLYKNNLYANNSYDNIKNNDTCKKYTIMDLNKYISTNVFNNQGPDSCIANYFKD